MDGYKLESMNSKYAEILCAKVKWIEKDPSSVDKIFPFLCEEELFIMRKLLEEKFKAEAILELFGDRKSLEERHAEWMKQECRKAAAKVRFEELKKEFFENVVTTQLVDINTIIRKAAFKKHYENKSFPLNTEWQPLPNPPETP